MVLAAEAVPVTVIVPLTVTAPETRAPVVLGLGFGWR